MRPNVTIIRLTNIYIKGSLYEVTCNLIGLGGAHKRKQMLSLKIQFNPLKKTKKKIEQKLKSFTVYLFTQF